MATCLTYCTEQDLRTKLSANGLLKLLDDSLSGSLSDSISGGDGTTEANILTLSLDFGRAETDAALIGWMTTPVSQDTSSLNTWLRWRAADLDIWWMFGRRGRMPPEQWQNRYEFIQMEYAKVRAGTIRVPDLVYPTDATDEVKRRRYATSRVIRRPGMRPE